MPSNACKLMQIPTVKISLVGSGRVGKSTIRSMLEGTPAPNGATIGVDVGKFVDEDLKAAIFDLGGQARFQMMWDQFMRGSKLVMLVTDSSREDVDRAKRIADNLQRMKGAKIIAIANKQDEANKLNAMQVEKILGLKTYPMVATEAIRRNAMVSIIKENLLD
ncbi:MAG: GTP-binding protein [Candidatus Lokiarchaeota archaeon]|nr:GTP-binding protein [Candidatus Lokiarchaeota archaeon]